MRIAFVRVAVAIATAGLLAACTLTEKLDDYSSGGGDAGTSADAAPDHAVTGDAKAPVTCTEANTKLCGATCQSTFDPEFGCAAVSCEACKFPNAAVDGCDSAGACRIGACLTGFENCNANAADGCEATLATDDKNCGGCHVQCDTNVANGGGECESGKCKVSSCATGYADCDAASANGCEVDINTDTAHCGACGTPCPTVTNTTFTCGGGACSIVSCGAGYIDCDKNAQTGCECGHPHATVQCVDPGAGAGGATCGFTACIGTFADCNANLTSDGCEIDTSSDANNCGTCGFSCEQGACVAGRCQPKQIIGSQGNPGQLVLDLDYAYWSNYGTAGINGSIYRVRKDAVNPTLIAGGTDTSENSAWGIATDDATSSVFWTTYSASSHVASALKVGGSKATVTAATGRLRGAVLDGSYLYWANYETSTILRLNVAVAGSTTETVATTANGVSRPNTIVFDATSIFWSNEGAAGTPTSSGVPTSTAISGSIMAMTKASIGSGAPVVTTLASGQDKPRGLAVDDSFAYFTNVGTNTNTGSLVRVGKDGTALTIIAGNLGTPREVALCTGTGCAADPYVYLSTYATGSILRVAKNATAGSTLTTLASGQKGPLGIATDAKYIFWANYGTSGVADGTIQKLVKQP